MFRWKINKSKLHVGEQLKVNTQMGKLIWLAL